MQHFVVTNRALRRRRVGGRLVELVTDEASMARPSFRVARFEPFENREAAAAARDEDFAARYALIPDTEREDYERLSPDDPVEGLRGTRALFLELYQCLVGRPAGGDVLFFIHGFNTDWIASLRHLQKLHELYVQDDRSALSRLVMFSWPSEGSLLSYGRDARSAAESGALLARLMAKLRAFFEAFFGREAGVEAPRCQGRLHLAAHSMGNRVLENAVRNALALPALSRPFFGEALLLNADVSWRALEPSRPLSKLPELADRVHVYNHASDDALLVSAATKNLERRLGREGPRELALIPPRTLVVDATRLAAPPSGAMPPLPGPAEEADGFRAHAERILAPRRVALRERLFDHWGYLYRREVIEDVAAVLRGASSDEIPGRERVGAKLFRLLPRGERPQG